MVRGAVVTTQLAPWHWQDKFEACDPEDAHRHQLLKVQQSRYVCFTSLTAAHGLCSCLIRTLSLTVLLQIEKQISFTKWLREKRTDERRRNKSIAAALAAKREEEQKEREAKNKERKEHKRRAKAEAQQRREERAQREQADARQREVAKVKSKRLRAQHDTVKHAYTDIMRCASAPKVSC